MVFRQCLLVHRPYDIFLYKDQLRALLLDYIPIETAHTGQAITEKVQESLHNYGLETSVRLVLPVTDTFLSTDLLL